MAIRILGYLCLVALLGLLASAQSPAEPVVDVHLPTYSSLTSLAGDLLLFVASNDTQEAQVWIKHGNQTAQPLQYSDITRGINFLMPVSPTQAIFQKQTGSLWITDGTTQRIDLLNATFSSPLMPFAGTQALFYDGALRELKMINLTNLSVSTAWALSGINSVYVVDWVECLNGLFVSFDQEFDSGNHSSLVYWDGSTASPVGITFSSAPIRAYELTCANNGWNLIVQDPLNYAIVNFTSINTWNVVDLPFSVTATCLTAYGSEVFFTLLDSTNSTLYSLDTNTWPYYTPRTLLYAGGFPGAVYSPKDFHISGGYLYFYDSFINDVSTVSLNGSWAVAPMLFQTNLLVPLSQNLSSTAGLVYFSGEDREWRHVKGPDDPSTLPRWTSTGCAVRSPLIDFIDQFGFYTYDSAGALILPAWLPETGLALVKSSPDNSKPFLFDDLRPGPQWAYLVPWAVFPSGRLLLAGFRSDVGQELFYIDGDGVLKLFNDYAPGCADFLDPFASDGAVQSADKSKVVFAARPTPADSAMDLWISNGTLAGTRLLVSNNTSSLLQPIALSQDSVTFTTGDSGEFIAAVQQPSHITSLVSVDITDAIASNSITWAKNDSAFFSYTTPNDLTIISVTTPEFSMSFTKGDRFYEAFSGSLREFSATALVTSFPELQNASFLKTYPDWNSTHFIVAASLEDRVELSFYSASSGFTHIYSVPANITEGINVGLDFHLEPKAGRIYFVAQSLTTGASQLNTLHLSTQVVETKDLPGGLYLSLLFSEGGYVFNMNSSGVVNRRKASSPTLPETVLDPGDFGEWVQGEEGSNFAANGRRYYNLGTGLGISQRFLVSTPLSCQAATECYGARTETACESICGASAFCVNPTTAESNCLALGKTCNPGVRNGVCVMAQVQVESCPSPGPEPADLFYCGSDLKWHSKGDVHMADGEEMRLNQQVQMEGDFILPPGASLIFDWSALDTSQWVAPGGSGTGKRELGDGFFMSVNGNLTLQGTVAVFLSPETVNSFGTEPLGTATKEVRAIDAQWIFTPGDNTSPPVGVQIADKADGTQSCQKASGQGSVIEHYQLNVLFSVDSTDCNLPTVIGVPVAIGGAILIAIVAIVVIKKNNTCRKKVLPFKDTEL